jgi:hypothetical protein
MGLTIAGRSMPNSKGEGDDIVGSLAVGLGNSER